MKDIFSKMEIIHRITCSIFRVNFYATFYKNRKRELVNARQITMSIAYVLFDKAKLYEIGKYFNKHHATVLHSIKVVNNLCFSEDNFRYKYEIIEHKSRLKLKNTILKKEFTTEEVIKELKKLIIQSKNIHTVIKGNELLKQLSNNI